MSREQAEDEAVPTRPGIPGMTRDEASVIEGDAPDEPAPDEDDGEVLDAEAGPLGVADDDTVGVSPDDDAERERGATEA